MGKIQTSHLARRACVYVRQSSMAQVEHHRESSQRQYNLRERAVALGWAAEQVEVIDEDQGKSGSSAEGRGGFNRLVSEVALGEVGAILGLEVSRLARSCVDWHRLLEIAALARALIIDEDGVYDPNLYNDRLLLGLKGTLSEAELHFLKQRMQGGRRNKAQRGELRVRLPAGYVWQEGEGIRKDPDEHVREAVELAFRVFERLGSAAKVAQYFQENQLPFPRRGGWGKPEVPICWRVLTKARVVAMLRNPVYAGVYCFDRHASEAVDLEDPAAGGRVLIAGSHAGYINVDEFERNVRRLVMNRNLYGGAREKGSPREGASLLQGIVLCGVCGRHMNVSYRRGSPVYTCRDWTTGRRLHEVNCRHVEPLVERELLAALSREELKLALEAFEKLAERAEELRGQWEKRIERARYEAEKAARRYREVEPENRLVARTLESEWNERLKELEELEKEYTKVKREPPLEMTRDQRQEVLALAKDIPRLWRAGTTRNEQRKELVRLLIEDITLRKSGEPWCVEVAIQWKTGVVTRHRAERVVRNPHRTTEEVVARVRELWKTKTDKEIAEILNREGHRSGYSRRFTVKSIERIRRSRGMVKPVGRGKRILKERREREERLQ